jgi:hypothetical protein
MMISIKGLNDQQICPLQIREDIQYDAFVREVSYLKGWQYQYHVLYLAEREFKRNNIVECANFLFLIEREKDFDPMLVAADFSYSVNVRPMLLKVLEHSSLSNIDIVMETFFPVQVAQERMNFEEIDRYLTEIFQHSESDDVLSPTLLTIILSKLMFSYGIENKEKQWERMYKGVNWKFRNKQSAKTEISSLFMVLDGNGYDVNIGDNNMASALYMLKATEDFLDSYENLEGMTFIALPDPDNELPPSINEAILPIHRRDISLSYDHLVAEHYTRIFTEFVRNMSDSRRVYWGVLTYLFGETRINPFFVLYNNLYLEEKFQERYLTCMIQVIWRLQLDSDVYERGESPTAAYASKIQYVDKKEPLQAEHLPSLYLQFLKLATQQITRIAARCGWLNDINDFRHKFLNKDELEKIVNRLGYIVLYQISHFLIKFVHYRLVSAGLKPLFVEDSVKDSEGKDDVLILLNNMKNLSFQNTGNDKETRFLYYDGINYTDQPMRDRFVKLDDLAKGGVQKKCLVCQRQRIHPSLELQSA